MEFTKEEIINYISEITGYSAVYDKSELEEEFEEYGEEYVLEMKILNNPKITFWNRETKYNISNEQIFKEAENLETGLIHCHPDTKCSDGSNKVEIWFDDENHQEL